MAREESGRWAVENICPAGTVRFMETSQEFVADIMAARANKVLGPNCVAVVVRIDK